MTPAPFTSALTAPLFGDAEVVGLMSDAAFVAQMVVVEAALARASAEVGLIAPATGAVLSERLAGLVLSPADLGAGMASAGVPVPALVAALQAACKVDADGLHYGATSQDIVDTAHVLQWLAALDVLGGRLAQLLDTLHAGSDAQAGTLMAGRTRSQLATPITLGLRMATWAQPLITLEAELPALRAQIARVQFGGAAGSASAVGVQAQVLTDALARDLGLASVPCWHMDRNGPQALGGWLVRLTAALAKMARDLIVAGRSEIAELRAGTGGGSSTMPQKSNPVAAETVVTLATYTAALQPLLAQAAQALEERDGAAWALEWLALPQMFVAAGAGLRHAQGLAGSLAADGETMRTALDLGGGGVMAEAASFALARHMPRAQAAQVIKRALATGKPLAQALASDPVTQKLEDWAQTLSPDSAIPAAEAMRARIWATRQG